MKLHPCLAAMGNTPDCRKCSISQAGLLEEFLDLLSRLTNRLSAETCLQAPDREEIIAEFAVRVHHKVDQFRGISNDGTRPVKFKTWGQKLFFGIRSDHFRKTLGRRGKGQPVPEFLDISDLVNPPSFDPEPAFESRLTLEAIRGMFGNNDMKDQVRLLIDHYEWQVQGLSQKDMAEKMGLNHAAYRKKISRARKQVLEALGDDYD